MGRERGEERERGRVAGRPSAGGGGAGDGSPELGVSRRRRGGSLASGTGDGKITGDGEDFGWKNLNEVRVGVRHHLLIDHWNPGPREDTFELHGDSFDSEMAL
ncbi:hypothetical protein TIFTF001_009379 [Ficus carica]|uniref:Uncharacterized protein n=1 Tax=Ficus carica TaxID=3494 RepID=A0AA88D1A0_FICCA|nr:hypothetical protein TIFTF001_009379 [Ficus carica]